MGNENRIIADSKDKYTQKEKYFDDKEKNTNQTLIENLILDRSIEANKEKIVTEYIPIFEKTYEKLEKIGDTQQLQECKKNTKEYIEKNLEPDFYTDMDEISKIRQLSKGERFLFGGDFGKHIKMELGEFKDINWINKKELEHLKNANKINKGDYFIRLHIDQGANLGKTIEKIKDMKIFLDIYKPKEKIKFAFLVSRLQDSEFVEYFRKRLKNNDSNKSSNIIKIYDELKNYLAKQGRLENIPIAGYNEFKDQFIIKDKDINNPSTLNQALAAYEKEGKRLKEGCLIIDLDKIKKMITI